MKNSKIQNRSDIIAYIYQSELTKTPLNADAAFESGDFSDNQLKRIESISKHYNKFKKIIIKYLKPG